MRLFSDGCNRSLLLRIVVLALGVFPAVAFADDDSAVKNATNSATKPVLAKTGTAAPLTDRERWMLDQLEALRQRVEELESKANTSAGTTTTSPAAATPAVAVLAAPTPATQQESSSASIQASAANTISPAASITAIKASSTIAVPPQDSTAASVSAPGKPPASPPFGYADWTWLNGAPRNKDSVWDSKYFTPEFRIDTNFMLDYNQPKDHTMGGSTEVFENGEVQLEQLSFGGDLHVGNVRGRFLTMYGLFATSTPRNDGSAGVGQWNLNDAYRYFSEAWGGYHFNVNRRSEYRRGNFCVLYRTFQLLQLR